MSEGLVSGAGGVRASMTVLPDTASPQLKLIIKQMQTLHCTPNEPFVNAQFGFNLFIFNYGSPHSIFPL